MKTSKIETHLGGFLDKNKHHLVCNSSWNFIISFINFHLHKFIAAAFEFAFELESIVMFLSKTEVECLLLSGQISCSLFFSSSVFS